MKTKTDEEIKACITAIGRTLRRFRWAWKKEPPENELRLLLWRLMKRDWRIRYFYCAAVANDTEAACWQDQAEFYGDHADRHREPLDIRIAGNSCMERVLCVARAEAYRLQLSLDCDEAGSIIAQLEELLAPAN
jgi:hypothetical protein